MNESNDKYNRKIVLLPGDLLKITLTTDSPVYVNLILEDVPAEERIFCEDIHYGGIGNGS